MISQADFEAAARGGLVGKRERRKIRRRPALAVGVDVGHGWSCAGQSGEQMFWPRYEDICLVTAGVRGAVLLDSRRAPLACPTLADVLRTLQDKFEERRDGRCDCSGQDIECLGILRLEGTCFLVNRAVLLSRLGNLLACPEAELGGSTTFSRGSVATVDDVARPPSGSPIVADRLWPGGGGAALGRERCFALLDVRKIVAVPTVCTDILLPRLCAALRSMFSGDEIGNLQIPPTADLHGGASPEVPPEKPTRAWEARVDSTTETSGEGRRWLQDWTRKELTLEGKDLRETLGGIGLPGLAGWLLEYPVIYCCPSLSNCEQGKGGAEPGDTGNCLAAAPLTVYSLCVEFGQEAARNSRDSVSPFEAFSFSVPETAVRCPVGVETSNESTAGGRGGEDPAVVAALHGLVEKFVEKINARVARHSGSCASVGGCQERRGWLHRLKMSKRTETLNTVAL